MLPDGQVAVRTVTPEEAAEFIRAGVENVANPSHGNTLDAVSRHLDVDVRSAKGGRIRLEAGDSCLVAEISGVPRETREFTDAEISAATFTFRLVDVLVDVVD
ncbi:MAG: hypothetical protein Q8P39_00735 [Candidatus Yanofskybacteria bacterium]|nr:hypothetical protein [Candidatus Yanofskybacteria bacterium]